ncbi:MAG: ribonuclease HII [bacterium]
MRQSIFQEEKKIRKLGFKKVIGLDEAGRGPLAGPVVAAAVMVKTHKQKMFFPGINDSKKMNPKNREKIFKLLINHSNIKWGIGKVSERVIDKINILKATKLAMKRAIKNMKTKPDFLILDGNFKIDSDLPQKPIVKADEKVFSCMAAGIIAKVVRDRIMKKYHRKFPLYGFDKHKGYPTKYHFSIINKNGICKIHRKSFSLLKKNR